MVLNNFEIETFGFLTNQLRKNNTENITQLFMNNGLTHQILS